MRRRRIAFYILWLLSLAGISFYGGVVSYSIFFALTLLPFVLFTYLIFCMATFKIYQQLGNKYVVCRTPITYYFTLQNETLLTFAALKVTFYEFGVDYGSLKKDEEYELMPHSGCKVTTNIACRYRGEYNIGVKNVIITDFLRLFSITYKNKEPLKVNIMPAIEYPDGYFMELEELVSGQLDKMLPQKKDILVRDYVSGDPFRHINWKATARSQKLMTSEMISEDLSNVTILLDTRRFFDTPEEYLPFEDELLTKLITLILYYVNNHIGVSLYFFSGTPKHISLSSMTEFDDAYAAISELSFAKESDTASVYENLKRENLRVEDSLFILSGNEEGKVLLTRNGQKNESEVAR